MLFQYDLEIVLCNNDDDDDDHCNYHYCLKYSEFLQCYYILQFGSIDPSYDEVNLMSVKKISHFLVTFLLPLTD